MNLPHIVREELLHAADEQQRQHLAQVLRAAEDTQATRGCQETERTPLLLQTPRVHHAVAIDLDKVEAILTAEENEAIEADAKLPARAIVREEATVLLGLSVPLVVTALLEFIPSAVLMMMVGHVSSDKSAQILAAFNLSSSIQGIFFGFVLDGLSSAIDTFCSQSFGGKRMVDLWLYCQAGLFVLAACMPFMIMSFISGSHILKALGQDPEIADIAGSFLLANLPAIPLGIVCTVITSSLQAQNIVVPFVISTLVSWTVACVAAYLLAFYTPLGYLGIALATPLCTLVKIMVLLPAVWQSEAFQDSWPGWKPREAMALLPKISKLGVSSVLMVTFQSIGFAITSLIAGVLPNASVMITVNNIFVATIQLSILPLVGVIVGGAIRIGNALGAGKARRAALVSHVVIGGALGISLVAVIATLFVVKPLAAAFTTDQSAIDASVDLTYKMLAIIPLAGFTCGFQAILRACGKQLLVAKLNCVCTFVVSSLLGLLFAAQFDGGLVGLWLGSLVGMALAAIAGGVWLSRVSWEQLAHEAKHSALRRASERASDAF